MSDTTDVNKSAISEDPEAFFATPAALLQYRGLSRAEQIAALQKWAFSVRARIDALSEGMLNHPEGDYTRDIELLDQIERALK